MEATNASRDVNVCLVPEFEFGKGLGLCRSVWA
jgi:hypothetical protein